MFEELLIIIGFMVFSLIISYILLTYIPEQLRVFVQAFSIVGVIIHELCHVFMCVISNTRVEKITLVRSIKSKNQEKYGYGGEVKVREMTTSFLQALLISIAPLFLSFWLFFFLWDQISNPDTDMLLFFIYLFIMISIFFSTAPSFADLAIIPKAFHNDVRYSLYQILLLIISISLTWILVLFYEIHVTHEVFIYITIMGVYYVFKYTFKGFSGIFSWIKWKNMKYDRPKKFKIKQFTRRRRKPIKPEKQW